MEIRLTVVVKELPGLLVNVSVRPEIVLREPSGSVVTDGGITIMVLNEDWLGELDKVSVVPGIVVREPSDSVETDGEIVVSERPGEVGSKVSVVPDIVVIEPFGSVDTDAEIVVSETPNELDSDCSVVADIVVNEPFGSVDTDTGVVVMDDWLEPACPDPVPPGNSVIVMPSVVIVVGDVTSGRERDSEPMTIGELGFTVYVELLMVTTSGKVLVGLSTVENVKLEPPLLIEETPLEFVVPEFAPERLEEVPLELRH